MAFSIDPMDVPTASNETTQADDVVELTEKSIEKALAAKMEGNAFYQQKQYEEAIQSYTQAILLTPEDNQNDMAIFHNNRAAANIMLQQYKKAIEDCTSVLKIDPVNVKALTRRAQASEKLNEVHDALADWKKIVDIDGNNAIARNNVRRLEPISAAKLEQQKDEMLGKLKDLGNNILGKFGMSLDNFKMNKDPNTGNYSVEMRK